MVDAESIEVRLVRLDDELTALDEVHQQGKEEFFGGDEEDSIALKQRYAAYHHLQIAEQACIDIGAQLLAEFDITPAKDYAEIFAKLQRAAIIDSELADWLKAAARQRNILVHIYLEVDDDEVWQTLGELDRFRQFATAVERKVKADSS